MSNHSRASIISPPSGSTPLTGARKHRLLFQLAMAAGFAVCSTTGVAGECDLVTMLQTYETSAAVLDDAICKTFVGLAYTKGVSCYWEFSFRSDEAELFFQQVWQEIGGCRKGSSTSGSNLVNHPDSYHMRELITERGAYRVAMKDKGQLNRTLVVVSFENKQ